MKKNILILIVIIATASFLRLYKLDTIPNGFNADEAALAYNAISLIETGKDEHGHPWPVNLESFGDYKPAGYAYVLIPFIKIFGASEYVVRLPSAIAGIITIITVYFLVKEIYSDAGIGLIAASVLTFSPWHIHFSRGAWEVNLATCLITCFVYFFFKAQLNRKFVYMILGLSCAIASMYVYQSARIIAPLIGCGLVLLYKDALLKKKAWLLPSIGLCGVLCLPLIYSIFTSNASSRLSGVGLLADEGPVNRINELRGQYADPYGIWPKIIHNRITGYGLRFVKNYADHFDPNFLFIYGDVIERNRAPETGQFYLIDIVFIGLGFCMVFKTFSKSKTIFFWVVIAPLAAAMTFQTPHALRAQNMVVPMSVVIALGISLFLKMIKKYSQAIRAFGIVLCIALYGWNMLRYIHEYSVHYAKTYPSAWEYGFKDLVSYISTVEKSYKSVVVTEKYDQPYILFLYYLQYKPSDFQTNHTLTERDKFNFSTVKSFDKYEFNSISKEKIQNSKNTLFVLAGDEEITADATMLNQINFPNGKPAFKIYAK